MYTATAKPLWLKQCSFHLPNKNWDFFHALCRNGNSLRTYYTFQHFSCFFRLNLIFLFNPTVPFTGYLACDKQNEPHCQMDDPTQWILFQDLCVFYWAFYSLFSSLWLSLSLSLFHLYTEYFGGVKLTMPIPKHKWYGQRVKKAIAFILVISEVEMQIHILSIHAHHVLNWMERLRVSEWVRA